MSASTPPRFITLEGGEGAGKSTQVKLLAKSFTAAGIPVVTTREPGGSLGAEAIRGLVVNKAAEEWHPVTESLLFMTARYDHIQKLILPALRKKKWVLCDRFFDSTLVYQGVGKGVDTDWLRDLYDLLFEGRGPDFTLLLDIDPVRGLARAAQRDNQLESRFEQLGTEYHQKIRAGFLALAETEPERITVIDAAGAPEQVHKAILAVLNKRFGLALKPAQMA